MLKASGTYRPGFLAVRKSGTDRQLEMCKNRYCVLYVRTTSSFNQSVATLLLYRMVTLSFVW